MKKSILTILISLVLGAAAQAADIYIAQTASGAANGADCADAYPVTWFNSSSNWAETPTTGKIGPGTTVHVCGTISSVLVPPGSGTSGNPITIHFEPNAIMSAATWPLAWWASGGAIQLYNNANIILDGGSNGIIEATQSNSTSQQGSSGIMLSSVSNVEVKNFTINNMYVRNLATDTVGGGVGITIAGGTNVSVHNNTISQAEVGIGMIYETTPTMHIAIYGNTLSGNANSISVGEEDINSNANDIQIYGNNITGSGTTWDSSNDTFHHNGIHVFAVASGDSVTNLKIDGNYIHGNWGADVTSWIFIEDQGSNQGMVSPMIFNNVLYADGNGAAGDGLIFARVSNTQIFNNTIVTPSGSGDSGSIAIVVAPDTSSAANILITNNIIYNFGALNGWIYDTGTADYISSNNLINQNPEFVDLAGLNFQLSSTSPAIGAGTNLSSYFTADYAGNTRPSTGAWDIGAYEFTGNTYYVDYVGGSDSNNGTSTTTPWKHCPGDPLATNNANIILQPGDTVVFKGGVAYQFSSSVPDYIAAVNSGTSGHHITYMSGHLSNPPWPDATDRAVIDGTNAGLSYPQFTGLISIYQYDYIDIRGFEIKNLPESVGQQQAALIGYAGNSGGHITIDNNVLHDSGAMGIVLQGQWQGNTPSGAVITNNTIYRTNSHNLMLRYGWQDVTIENNFFDTPGFAVYAESGSGNSGTAGDNIDLAPDIEGPTSVTQSNVVIKGNTFDYSNLLYGQAPTKSHILISATQQNLTIDDNVFQGFPNVASIDTPGYVNGEQIINNLFNDDIQEYEGVISYYTDQGNMETSTGIDILNNTIVSTPSPNHGIFFFAQGNNTNPPPLFTHVTIQNNIADTASNSSDIFYVGNNSSSGEGILDITSLSLSNNVYNAGSLGSPFYINESGYNFSGWQSYLQAKGAISADSDSSSGSVDFINRSGEDFLLSSSDTLARNQGLNLSSIFTTDINGNPRPATGNWDIGAFQYTAGQTVPTAPALSVTIAGKGEVLGPNISCGINSNNLCENPSMNTGAVAALTASPATGYVFSSWSGCNSVAGNPNICTVTMNSAQNVTANFTTSSSIILGDVNTDGQVSIADAEMAAQAAVGLITLTSAQQQAVEVDGTGKLDIYDAYLIAEYAVGLITKFPVQG